jgi:hypothetical protein
VTRMFGLPGGEMLDFLEAARRAGIRFILTRHEATAAFMADVTGQIQRRPGRLRLHPRAGRGQHDAGRGQRLPRSLPRRRHHGLSRAGQRAPTPRISSSTSTPCTGPSRSRRSRSTARIRRRRSARPCAPRARCGWAPSHIALPSDVGRGEDRPSGAAAAIALDPPRIGPAPADAVERVAAALAAARRPLLILGLDLDPQTDVAAVRAFVERMDVPTFVTPKAKGMLPEDQSALRRRLRGRGRRSRGAGFLRARRPARGRRVRARRVGQAVAPDDAAGLGRSGVDRGRRLPSPRGSRRRRPIDAGRAGPPPARAPRVGARDARALPRGPRTCPAPGGQAEGLSRPTS